MQPNTSFLDGKSYDLVMSDEFNRDGRRFVNGHDPTWTAIGTAVYISMHLYIFAIFHKSDTSAYTQRGLTTIKPPPEECLYNSTMLQ